MFNEIRQNVPFMITAGVLLVGVLLLLRLFFKVFWKILRVAAVVLSILLIAGFIIHFLNLGWW